MSFLFFLCHLKNDAIFKITIEVMILKVNGNFKSHTIFS